MKYILLIILAALLILSGWLLARWAVNYSQPPQTSCPSWISDKSDVRCQ